MKILVYGDLIIDETITGEVSRVSPEAPCMVVKTDDESAISLGGAANVAENLAAMLPDATIRFHSAQSIPSAIRKRRPRTVRENLILRTLSGAPAPIKQRIVARNHQLLRLDIGDSPRIDSDAILMSWEWGAMIGSDYDAIVIADYRKGTCSVGLIHELLNRADELGCPVFVDAKPGGRPDSIKQYDRATLRKWNRLEAQVSEWLPRWAQDQAETYAETRGQTTVITLDKDGAVWSTAEGESGWISAEPVEAIDPTGAGDTFLAALVTAQVTGHDLRTSIAFANKAAARAVSTRGTAIIDGVL